ncbi:MAG: hypothetical protein M3312_10215 [Actinomycetota bacterium]|nr:hypothetical protein [Actinomycetota bacterium]
MRLPLQPRLFVSVALLGLLAAVLGFVSSMHTPGAAPAPAIHVAKAHASAAKPHASKTDSGRRPHGTSRGAPPGPAADVSLRQATRAHGAAVVFIYSPRSAVDRIAAFRARAASEKTDAGFVAVDASRERDVRYFAREFGVRRAPTLLVFAPGPALVTQLDGVFDQKTVAQAVENTRSRRARS